MDILELIKNIGVGLSQITPEGRAIVRHDKLIDAQKAERDQRFRLEQLAKNPQLLTLPENARAWDNAVGKGSSDRVLYDLHRQQLVDDAIGQLIARRAGVGGSTAAPTPTSAGAAPSAPPNILAAQQPPPSGTAEMTPAVATTPAPAPAPAPTPAPTTALPSAAPAPTGGTVVTQPDVAPRGEDIPSGMEIRGKVGTGRYSVGLTGPSRAESDTIAFQQYYQATLDALKGQGMVDRYGAATPEANAIAAAGAIEAFDRAGRLVPDWARSLSPTAVATKIEQARSTRQAQLQAEAAPLPGQESTGKGAAATIAGQREAAVAEAKRNEPIPAKDRALTLYPTGHPLAGQALQPGTTQAQADALGAVTIHPTQLPMKQGFGTAYGNLKQMSDAADVLNNAHGRFARLQQLGRAGGLTFDSWVSGDSQAQAAFTKLKAAQDNIFSFLRSPAAGERGNIAARIVERQKNTAVAITDSQTQARAKLEFLGGVMAASLYASGLPITAAQNRLLTKLSPDILAEIAKGAEPTPPAAAPMKAPPSTGDAELDKLLGLPGAK